MAIAEAE